MSVDACWASLLKTAMERMQLSAQAYDRILKVARTAVDLAGSADIRIEDLAEANHYRSLDREEWVGRGFAVADYMICDWIFD